MDLNCIRMRELLILMKLAMSSAREYYTEKYTIRNSRKDTENTHASFKIQALQSPKPQRDVEKENEIKKLLKKK